MIRGLLPNRFTEAHIAGEKRIRDATTAAVERAWRDLSGYDRENIPEFLGRAVPAVRAGVRASVMLTSAYLARSREVQLRTVDVAAVERSMRNGVLLDEVYARPFVSVWTALDAGKLWADAVDAGLARATASAAMDPQLAMRDTANRLDNGYGYRRVADGDACQFCQQVNGAYVKGNGYAMALHNHCGCSLEPLSEPHKGAVFLPDGTQVRKYAYGPLNDKVAVHEHGELGAVLTDPAQTFTSL